MQKEINLLKTLRSLQSPQPENRKDQKIVDLPRVSVLQILAVLCLSLIPLSCSKVPDFIKDTFQPEMIVPVFDPDAYIMPQTGTVGYLKNGIKVMAVPLNDVKAVDAFGIFIYNGTDHWISFKEKDCQMLDGTGNVTKPIDKSQESFYLKKNFRPQLPPEFSAEVFRWDKSIRIQGDPRSTAESRHRKNNNNAEAIRSLLPLLSETEY